MSAARSLAPARHEAAPYSGADEFVPACVSLADEALSHQQRLILLAGEARLGDVRDALGGRAEDLALVATDRHGRNPSRITSLLDSFQAAADGRRSIAITDWGLPGRSGAVFTETQLAESLLNVVALQTWPLDVVCLYDATALEPPALTEVRRVHPVVRGQDANVDYQPDLAAELFAAALLAVPDGVETIHGEPDELSRSRRMVRDFAAAGGLPADRVEDLVIAANEIVTNSMRHGGGTCRMTLWRHDGSVVCEVVDGGHITDPLAGRLAAAPTATSGRGLWLANQLCDLVQIRSSAAGTVVRLYVDHL